MLKAARPEAIVRYDVKRLREIVSQLKALGAIDGEAEPAD